MPDKPKSKRRKMKSFKLEEISVVDKPAQEGAKMALMKRDDNATSKAVPLSTRLIKHYLDTGTLADAAITGLTKSAGAEKAVGCWPAIAAVEQALQSVVRSHSLNDVQKVEMMKSTVNDFLTFTKQRLPDIESHLLKAVSTEDNGMNLRQLQKQMGALSRKLDGALALLEKSAVEKEGANADPSARLREALMTEKAGEDELPPFMQGEAEKAGDEDEYFVDEEAEKAGDEDEYFVDEETEKAEEAENEKPTTEGEEEDIISAGSASPIGGKRDTTKRDDKDEVLQIGKHTIRKSAISGDLFEILKSQQGAVDRLAKQAADERNLRELVEFSKVAEDELPHLPGTVEEKAVILKRLSDVLGPNERVVMSRMLKAGNAGVSKAFESVGHRVSKAAVTGSFSKRVNEIRARDNCSHMEAMRKARVEHPDEFAAYQGH